MRLLPIIGATMALLTIGSSPAFAHGGRLNSEGCHNNRKTGDYHCHRASIAPSPSSASRFEGNNSTLDNKPVSSSQAYRNCAAARAAGAAPVRRGEPGYGTHLDRDNDGIGCE